MASTSVPIILGIDFGTSKLCASLWIDGNVTILENSRGEKKVPAFAVLEQDERTGKYRIDIGRPAKDLSAVQPYSCLFNLLYFANTTEAAARDVITRERLPFIYSLHEFSPRFSCTLAPGKPTVLLVLLLAELIRDMRDQAELKVQKLIKKCVITVPTHWNQSGYYYLNQAAQMAGFQDIQFIHTTKAALMGCMTKTITPEFAERENIFRFLVVDFGAASCSVIMYYRKLDQKTMTQISQIYTCPGGNFLDWKLLEHCADEFQRQYGVNVMVDCASVHRIRLACEDAKIRLSTAKFCQIKIGNLKNYGQDLAYTLTLAAFEDICGPVVQTIIEQMRTAIQAVEGSSGGSHSLRILLLGGGSRIPLVRKLIGWAFPGIMERSVLGYAEEAAALGAASFGGHNSYNVARTTRKTAVPQPAPVAHQVTYSNRHSTYD
ncbi:putative Heat shock protein SSB1 [Hypsibius exemplaris]|uniref:Heat shock protein SSB1 n=1 Tax=Hypsibius exemplaris TaxID=2072580 RepID=A0A9X6NLW2_HYPEX|nr:putative Heat shock protein SSB1 [Hypsibius exemplaris]